jgi:competence/damage-inducible protein CinA-like protein
MPSAEIITIGTEILLGDILDTNAPHIARAFRAIGLDVYRKTSVGDNARRIAQMIQEALDRAEVILTTGGLGPTVDDPTRDAIALAFDVPTEFRPDLWDQIQARFRRFHRQPTDNNRRQAYVPQGSIPLENPVGTAPGFIMERGNRSVIALPGVPSEMETMLQQTVIPYLRHRYHLTGLIKTRILHTAGLGESQIDDQIGDLEALTNPTVGLAAHAGQVDVRLVVKAETESQADQKLGEVENLVHQRLGEAVYGADDETLQGVLMRKLVQRGWKLAVVECGLSGELIGKLAGTPGPFVGGEMLCEPGALPPSLEDLSRAVDDFRQSRRAEVGLGVVLAPAGEMQNIYMALATPLGVQTLERPYGGPPQHGPRWAINHGINLARINL